MRTSPETTTDPQILLRRRRHSLRPKNIICQSAACERNHHLPASFAAPSPGHTESFGLTTAQRQVTAGGVDGPAAARGGRSHPRCGRSLHRTKPPLDALEASQSATGHCAVPYPVMTGPHSFWFGTEKLWTLLPRDGTGAGLGHYRPTDTAFRPKLFWWREGYDWDNYQPPLKVTGKRIDSPAPPLATDEHANGSWTDDREHPFSVSTFPRLAVGRSLGASKIGS